MVAVARDIYPFDGHYFDRQGLKYHYLDEGRGEPVVMLHGNPSWSLYFRELVIGLRDRCRAVVPDHLGCGYSDKPDDGDYEYTLKSRVDDLEALLAHLGLERDLTLVLHDWGGMIGMAYAARYPERVRRLIVLNTAAFRNPRAEKLPISLWLMRNTAMGPLLIRGLNAFARGATVLAVTRTRMAARLAEAYCAPYDSWRNRIATLRFVQDIPLRPEDAAYEIVLGVEAALPRFQAVPMLICWGEKDFVFDGPFLEAWLRHFPLAEVHRFPDCGHYVLEEAAGEIVPLVQSFLRAHPLTQV